MHTAQTWVYSLPHTRRKKDLLQNTYGFFERVGDMLPRCAANVLPAYELVHDASNSYK